MFSADLVPARILVFSSDLCKYCVVPLCARIKNVYLQDTLCYKVLLSAKTYRHRTECAFFGNFLSAQDGYNGKRAKESLVLCLP